MKAPHIRRMTELHTTHQQRAEYERGTSNSGGSIEQRNMSVTDLYDVLILAAAGQWPDTASNS